jgi:DNA-binding MarR family transcriptional regulator
MDKLIHPTDTIPVGIPVLLRTARKTYSWAVRDALLKAELKGVPHNGVYVLLGIVNGSSTNQLIRDLGISKQAASQLIDGLVENDYVARSTSTLDRRKQVLSLTEKGAHAASAIRQAIDEVNTELVREVGNDNEQIAKYVLAVLIDINDRHHNLPRGIR